jgi:hypothetical protein
LHGFIHLLYFGQSARFFELQTGLLFPDHSWAFSRWLGVNKTRILVSLSLILAAVGFVIAGVGVIIEQAWGQQWVIISSIFSSVIYMLFWDGNRQRLADQGAVGILINLILIVIGILLRWLFKKNISSTV